MDILVICQGCNTKFKVNEKHAGKRGACPKCKTVITIPDPEAVKIHAPEEFAAGGKSATGQLLTKPITRKPTKIKPAVLAAGLAGGAVVLTATWLGGEWIRELAILRIAGVLGVSLPLVLLAYSFLRNDELEPYRGQVLLVRGGICAVIYAALWGVYAVLPESLTPTEMWNWLLVAPPLLILGALAAVSCLDLEWGNALFHYAFFLLATLALRAVAGMPALWGEAAPAATRTLGL